jgi:opine dehydrogenase
LLLPASARKDVARLATRLRSGQVVVLNPGRTGGALEFRHILNQMGCAGDVMVAETGTFLFASRSTGPAQARISRRKNAIPLAALPATHTNQVLERAHDALPQFIPAVNVLHTGLDNMGAVFHPALTLLSRLERPWYFEFTSTLSPLHRPRVGVLDRER